MPLITQILEINSFSLSFLVDTIKLKKNTLTFGAMNKSLVFKIGALTYLCLFIFSVVFYKERTVILDASFQLFNILKTGSLAIQVNRFGAAFTQIFPLLASKMLLPLYQVAGAYSVGFILYYFTCFLIILFGFKSEKIALILVFFHTLIVTHSFYWIQCELIQGVSFTLVFVAFVEQQIQREKVNLAFYILLPFFFITIVFFYPLLPFVLFFALIYFGIHYKSKLKFLSFLLGFYLLLYVLKITFFKTDYDTSAMDGMKNIRLLFPHYFDLQSNIHFLQYCLHDYYALPILLIASIIFYVLRKMVAKLFLLLFFFFGFLFIVNVCFAQGAEQFYLEPQYTILSVFLGFVIAFDILPAMQQSSLRLGMVLSLIIISLARIFYTHYAYTDRLNWYQNVLDTTAKDEHKKIILATSQVPMDKIKMGWGSSFEFWLLSTLETGITRSIIIEGRPNEFDDGLNMHDSFIIQWGAYPYSDFHSPYFHFEDTTAYVKK